MDKIKISMAAARVNAGMTQKDVAKKLHVSNKTIVNWENGISEPSFATVQALSHLYKIPVNCILLPKKFT
jgi:DNA-binding XRE family transcriptional regulator